MARIIVVTGAGGLIGSAVADKFLSCGDCVVGIDNNSRQLFFGKNGSVSSTIENLMRRKNYIHHYVDIADATQIDKIFKNKRPDVIVNCAAQPSHDYAASAPFEDFNVNAKGTLVLLESARRIAKDSVFVQMSTNKVYGDAPNFLEIEERQTRYELVGRYADGIDESLTVDNSTHSLFGVSKLYGDILAQEYGRYFNMKVGIFRCGCLTGPQHAGVRLHGFLSYIVKCAVWNEPYCIFGYKGKQVRDQLHAEDVAELISIFAENPTCGEVYNLGGGKNNSISIIETLQILKDKHGVSPNVVSTLDTPRKGDHICYFTDNRKIMTQYKNWKIRHCVTDIIEEIVDCEKRKKSK